MNRLKRNIVHYLAIKLPDSCPFNITINIGKLHLFTIPPLCKLNPLYEEVIEEKLRIKGYLF